MDELDDLKAKVAKLQADITAFIAANTGGASNADLVALGTQIDAIDAQVNPPTA